MNEKERLEKVANKIVGWYPKEARTLPWREDKNPYHIWISEIMLQQTRIEAVKEYYMRFMKELPTIADLAKIEEEKLLKLWEGLGYYNRARNLKKAAIIMVTDYQGNMPSSYEKLVKLPGIGEYTAGAIASIAFNERVTAVDGNVLRVMARVLKNSSNILLPKTKKEMTEKLEAILPKEAGIFNEGIMELGETICLPNGKPLCDKCPIAKLCIAHQEGIEESLPIREKNNKRKVEQKTVFVFQKEDRIAIRKREEKGLLASLYEFPSIEGHVLEKEIKEKIKKWNLEAESCLYLTKYRHVFSHKEWDMIAYHVVVKEKNKEFLWVTKIELQEKYPLPSAFLPFQKELDKREKEKR